MKTSITLKFYEVFGCKEDGTSYDRGCLFNDKINACAYAYKNKGKISYGMPYVAERTTTFNDSLSEASETFTRLDESEIVRFAKMRESLKDFEKDNDSEILCPRCEQSFDLEDCETDKYWEEDRTGVSHHLVEYQCPHCGAWISEKDL